MKRMTLILSILILATVVLLACGPQGQPRIYFEQDSVDVGKVPVDVPLEYTFKFKNIGDAPLVLEGVGAQALEGCWPGKVVVGPTTLQPGDEGILRIETPSMKDMDTTGMHLFEITVESNDPVEPEKKVYLRADFVLME